MLLDHVALIVADLEAARRELAALPLGPIEEFDGENTRETYVHIAPARVLLVQARSASGPIARRGPGFHHLAFQVTDVRATIARLGWEVLPSTERSLARGGPAWVLRRAGGVLLELMPVANLTPPEGPPLFRRVIVEAPLDAPLVESRPGDRGVVCVELTDGRLIR